MRRLYRRFIPTGSLCFDVGANRGRYCQAFFDLGARVVAVEPQSTCLDELTKRFGVSERVQLVHAAVGAAPGRASLRLSNVDEASTLSEEFIAAYQVPSKIFWNATVDVTVVTLDELIGRFGVPAFCKLDIEGWDAEALKGLSQPLAALSVEYVVRLRHRALECVERLEALGTFEFNFSAYENFKFSLNSWAEPSLFKGWLSSLSTDVRHGDVFARRRGQ
jgi:FkbM family methyltransferase